MKSSKLRGAIVVSIISCFLILIGNLLIANDTNKKSNIMINYNRDNISNKGNEVRVIPENKNVGVDFIPIPDKNNSIILDAL